MPNLGDYTKSDKGIFLLAKGGPNTGKTTAVLSFPNVVVLDFDVKMPNVAVKHYKDRTDITWEYFNDIFQLSKLLEEWQIKGCPYETIVADSVTNLSSLVIQSAGMVKGETVFTRMQDAKEVRLETERKSKLDKGKTQIKDNIDPIGMDYYNTETAFFCTYFISALKRLWMQPGNPKNVIVIAHDVAYESAPDLKTKVVTTTRSILTTGRKPATWIPTQFDDMFTFVNETQAFSTEGAVRKAQTVNIDVNESRTTLNLPREITLDFKNGTFYDAIRGAFER